MKRKEDEEEEEKEKDDEEPKRDEWSARENKAKQSRNRLFFSCVKLVPS